MPISSEQAYEAFVEADYRILDVRAAHVIAVEGLPPLHSDLFDRLLVAQSLTEPMVLLTRDERVASYGGNVIKVG